MADENEAPDSGGESTVAMSLALAGASRAEADAFLRDQRHCLAEQIKHLDLGIWEKRIGIALRLATLVVGLAVAGALGKMVWDADHSKGLIMESFSVPGDMAGRGLNGQVMASRMIDKLTAMTARESSRAAQSYANNWGDNIKVEIPETGVSIGELRNFLREWLGHDIRITGEVFRTPAGITVTARAGGGDPGASFVGAETDLDALLQKAAEHIYETTQPYRYANYLDRNYDPVGMEDRVARATVIYNRLIAGDDLKERAWALNGLGTIEFNIRGNDRLSEDYYRRAIATVPDFTIGYYALAARNGPLGQEEESLRNQKEANRLLSADPVPDLNPAYAVNARISSKAQQARQLGDYTTAIALFKQQAEMPDAFSVLSRGNGIWNGIRAIAAQHNLRAIAPWLQQLNYTLTGSTAQYARIFIAAEAGDWRGLLATEAQARAALATAASPDERRSRAGFIAGFSSQFALAHAHLGDFAGAEAVIARLPADNDPGLRTRGQLAEMQGQHARADWWFARAEAQEPNIPFADEVWGQALLARGQPDAAIGKFTLASKKGPHFADPLEGWGEALMAKNQSHLALAKFAEAEKYAPGWGRLHLKWGEALAYAGKPAEAKAEFARAAVLDLAPGEKAELAKIAAL